MNALSKAKRIRERRRYEDLLALNLDGAFPPKPPLGAPFLTPVLFFEKNKYLNEIISVLYYTILFEFKVVILLLLSL